MNKVIFFNPKGLIILGALAMTLSLQAQTVVKTVTASENWTIPANVISITVEAWGGGGGGGASFYGSGGGGGGGAYSTATWTVTPGESYSITIGSGGNPGNNLVTSGGQVGGASSVSGAAGTLTANGGTGGGGGIGYFSVPSNVNNNGSGGSGATGTYNGGNGATASNSSGSGGGGAGNAGNGGNGTTSALGAGGTGSPNTSPYKGGNGGAYTSSSANGNNGNIPGGGGSGARSWNSASTRVGGYGARGQVVITYTPVACTNGSLTLTSATGTDNQTHCFNIPVDNITYQAGGDATGATASGLPSGVSGVFNSGVFTISGTPTQSGTFNYTVTTTGVQYPCTEGTANGTIVVNPSPGVTANDSAIFNESTSWEVPETVISLTAEAWGGGGAGGGAELTFLGIGGGGGGGAHAIKNSLSVTPASNLDIVVSPSAGGVAAGTGADGGYSTITGYENQIYAAGGKGGKKSIPLSPYPDGGEGGKASDSKGDCTVSGINGLNGFRITAAIPVPVPGPNDGKGGAGAPPNGGSGGPAVGEFIGNGNPGSAPGGGGSGSRSAVSLTFNTTGGAGAAGKIKLFYTCPTITSAGIIDTVQTICFNTIPAEIFSKTDASATAGTIAYKWQSSTVSGTDGFSDISGATASAFTPGALSETTWFRRVAKPKCSSAFPDEGISNAVEISVLPQFLPGETDTTGESVCYNSVPGTIGSVSVSTGGDGNYHYQWQSSANGTFSDAIDISGATDLTYGPPALTSTTSFRRMTRDNLCKPFTAPSSVWKVTVFSPSVGGNVSGGATVCYGNNSTTLTLSGNTGSVVNWQYSVNGTDWTDITAATSAGYTAVNLTADTWYRVKVKNGPCEPVYSGNARIVMGYYKIFGYAQYDNNPKTPLDGLKITLKKDGVTQSSYTTGVSGYYEFQGLVNASSYSLSIESAIAGGQWQTWGGVNNTDAQKVLDHINNVSLLPVNPPVIRITASVKEPHPQIAINDYNAIRVAAKSGWGSPPNFQIPKWVFSGVDLNHRLDSFALNCADVQMNIRGLCAGDVNASYVPGTGYKMAMPGLALHHSETIPVSGNLLFPVYAMNDMEIGAVTLLLDYDQKSLEITGVTIPSGDYEQPDFSNDNGTLYIGWNSMTPLRIKNNEIAMFIRARIKTADAGQSNPIRFALNQNPLSELADIHGNVISGAQLSIPDASGIKSSAESSVHTSLLGLYPNPATELVNVSYSTDEDAVVSYTVTSLGGVNVLSGLPGNRSAGVHQEQIAIQNLAPGVYFLKISIGNESFTRKIVKGR